MGGMRVQVELVWDGRLHLQGPVPAGKPRHGLWGCGVGGQASFKGTSRRLSQSRELGEGDVQTAGSALLAEQATGYLV